MCDQRERLIGYVYNECEPGERDEMQRHLETCDVCRTEIASLRSVREDLLAWDVPAHESVWRPFAPAPAKVWWQQVPRWAMAAAAGLVVLSGAAGGVMAHALMPHPETAVAGGNTAVVSGITANDLSAAEQRVLARMAAQMADLNARVQLASSRSDSGRSLGVNENRDLTKELLELRRQNDDQFDLITRLNNNMGNLRNSLGSRTDALQARIENLQALILQPAR